MYAGCSANKRGVGTGNASKELAILIQLRIHFKAKHEKGVGMPFPHVPASLYSCAVAYLRFPARGDKVSLGAPTQSVRGSTDAKKELGVKGRRQLSRARYKVVSTFMLLIR